MRAATGWNVHRTNTTVAWPRQFELLSALWVIPRKRTLGQESGTVPSAKASRMLAAAQANCSRFSVSEETFAGLLLVCSRWGRSRWLTQWDRRALHFQNPIQSPERKRGVSERKISRQESRHHPATKREATKREQQGSRHNKTNLKQQRRVAEPIQASGNTSSHRGASSQLAALTLMSTPVPAELPHPQISRGTGASMQKGEQKAHTFLKSAQIRSNPAKTGRTASNGTSVHQEPQLGERFLD